MSALRDLLNIITTGVSEIDDAYSAASRTYPTLDDPWVPDALEDQFHFTAERVAAAAYQLMVLLRKPPLTVNDAAMNMYNTIALTVIDRANVVEILTEAGPQGLHINEVASKSGISPRKLGQFLRLLTSRAIFKEVEPDVFANNRLSSVLDTGKTLEQIQNASDEKYNNSNGVMAFAAHTADEVRKASSFLPDLMFDPKTRNSEDLQSTAFKAAFPEAQGGLFQWLNSPDNSFRRNRFNAAMVGSRAFFPEKVILQGFDWASLPPGSKIVDVGGGIGSTSLVLAKELPQSRIVIQDLPPIISDAEKYWKANHPEAIASGQVSLTGHDFFTTQPVKDAAVFLLRGVTHDWPNTEAKQILKLLRDAAASKTRLILAEMIVPYASSSSKFADIHGADEAPTLKPMVPNIVSAWFTTSVSIQMLTQFNSQERTIGEFVTLGEETGWKLVRVYRGPHNQLEFIPV